MIFLAYNVGFANAAWDSWKVAYWLLYILLVFEIGALAYFSDAAWRYKVYGWFSSCFESAERITAAAGISSILGEQAPSPLPSPPQTQSHTALTPRPPT
jgi:hypothetical protein